MSDAFSRNPTVLPSAARPDPDAPPFPTLVRPAGPTRPRLWPAVIIVALVALVRWGPALLDYFAPDALNLDFVMQFMGMMYAPMVGAALIAIWWLAFSRVRWYDRVLGLVAFAAIGAAAIYFADSTIQGMPMIFYALPVALIAWVGWLLLTPFLPWPARRIGLLATFLVAWGAWCLVTLTGMNGSFWPGFALRGGQTPELKFLAELAAQKAAAKEPAADAAPLALKPGDWPAFRGADRDGRLHGVRIAADWGQHPPKQLWKHRVGPGWSSFAAIGDRVFTQEQRGPEEAVVCYNADTGEEMWAHTDAARFEESMAGAGPRATPTFHDGKIYAYGAAGRLNCLDAATGKPVWTRDVIADAKEKLPDAKVDLPIWGFASSPLVAEGVVMVFTGVPDKCMAGYDAKSGEPAWDAWAGAGKTSYCSPHPAKLDGADQVLIATDQGLTSIEPKKGKVLWSYDAPLGEMGARCIQPTILPDSPSDVLLGSGMGAGTRKLRFGGGSDGSTQPTELWSTKAISPYFNDVVVYKGFLYGFERDFLTCVNLEDGKKKWSARGYQNGQVLLLADQGLLLVLTEMDGVVALLEATPEGRKELCRFQALEKGVKTWNHPVVAHGKLFVRNGEEAACYQLTEEGLAGK